MLSDATLDMLQLSYDRTEYSDEDFDEDVSRVYSVIRALRKYSKRGQTTPRLVINNIVILYNVFGQNATFALDEEADPSCKVLLDTCLFLMGRRLGCEVDTDFLEYLENSLK